jgi:hypothetical protein
MKTIGKFYKIGLLLIFFNTTLVVIGQTTGPTPNRVPTEQQKNERQKRDDREALERLGNIDKEVNAKKPVYTVSRKPTKKDRAAIAVNTEDKKKFAQFLKQPGTGILRLHDYYNCETQELIVNAAITCPENLVGRGSAYSFRDQKYTNLAYSDILFENAGFHVRSKQLLGFLTDLGDIPLENVSLLSAGVDKMAEFAPSDKIEVFENNLATAERGFRIGDFFYTASLLFKENSTYALRSIAFRFKQNKSHENLSVDGKTSDIIVVFRVVRKHEDGSISLLWKQLQEKDAPTIELE